MNVTARDFPEVYEDLGIDTGLLGCVMIDTEPIKVSDIISRDDLYFADPELHSYTQGVVSETVPHTTILYGLMRTGLELKKHVDRLLEGWEPGEIIIDKIDFFYGKDEQNSYITIIALLKITDELKDGNGRLRLLPHIDTFQEYNPHITLAYVKDSSGWQEYINLLNEKYGGKTIQAKNINYGGN